MSPLGIPMPVVYPDPGASLALWPPTSSWLHPGAVLTPGLRGPDGVRHGQVHNCAEVGTLPEWGVLTAPVPSAFLLEAASALWSAEQWPQNAQVLIPGGACG